MMTDSMHHQQSLRRKTRSASICAPGSSSMEQMLDGVPPKDAAARMILAMGGKKDSGSATPESSSTPTRRRRPATRSQSARVSGANKSIRRRAAQQGERRFLFAHCLPLTFSLFRRAFEIIIYGNPLFHRGRMFFSFPIVASFKTERCLLFIGFNIRQGIPKQWSCFQKALL